MTKLNVIKNAITKLYFVSLDIIFKMLKLTIVNKINNIAHHPTHSSTFFFFSSNLPVIVKPRAKREK